MLTGGRPARFKAQRAAYRQYVESGLGQDFGESPLAKAAAGLLCGSEAWVERMRGLLQGERREQRALRELEARPDWGTVQRAVEEVKGEKWEQFRDRHGDWGRDLALYVARRACGMSLASLGREVGMENYYAVAQAILRFQRRMPEDRRRRAALAAVFKCIKIGFR